MAITRPTTRPSNRSRSSFIARDRSPLNGRRQPRRTSIAAFTVAFIAGGVPGVHAQTWRVVPSIAAESTYTTNVDLTSSGSKVADWVNQLTPSVTFSEVGAHSKIVGAVSVPILLYARTSENNYAAPQANINGTFEAVERLFFVDATVNVSQQYVSPFGAHPNNLVNATDNRYTAQTYTVSPYLKGSAADGIDYELRQRSIWSDANATLIADGRSYTNQIVGHVARAPAPSGWSLDYDRSDIKFSNEQREVLEIARARATYRVDPTLQLSAIVGYENQQFLASTEKGPTYGVGFQWRPTNRTTADAVWEHRFFGSSYQAGIDHRGPLSVWSFRAYRDITTYPQQLAQFQPGGNIAGLLNSLFLSRVPDPLERQAFVDNFIRARGLPTELAGPLTLFTEQITLVESATATLGLIGARNTVFFTAYRVRNEPVSNADNDGLAIFEDLNRVTQLGVNAIWTHLLTSTATFEANLGWARATQNVTNSESTDQYTVQALVRTPLTSQTSVYAGTRYQDFRSNIGDFNDFAVFVGITHVFH